MNACVCVDFLNFVWDSNGSGNSPIRSHFFFSLVCERACVFGNAFVCTCIEWKTIAQICTKLLREEKPACEMDGDTHREKERARQFNHATDTDNRFTSFFLGASPARDLLPLGTSFEAPTTLEQL